MKIKKLLYVISLVSLTTASSFTMEEMTKIPELNQIRSQAEQMFPADIYAPEMREILISAHVAHETKKLEQETESKRDEIARAG